MESKKENEKKEKHKLNLSYCKYIKILLYILLITLISIKLKDNYFHKQNNTFILFNKSNNLSFFVKSYKIENPKNYTYTNPTFNNENTINNKKIKELSLVGTLKGGLYAIDNKGVLKWQISIGKPLMYQKAELQVRKIIF